LLPDAYTLRARVAPAALLSIPALALLTVLGLSPASLGFVGAGTIAALTTVAAGKVADRGRALQERLFAAWGGSPTTIALSLHNSGDLDRVRARRVAIEALSGRALPSADAERDDPVRAQAAIQDAVGVVRARLREDDGNRILADVNAEYGFRRNCLGIRVPAGAVAVACALASAALWIGSAGARPAAYAAPCAVGVALVGFWWLMVTESWMRSAADRYADQFYETVNKFPYPVPTTGSKETTHG
jgi:hypothetical protein